MAYGYPSSTGAYVPTAIDRNLLIGFARNPDKFVVNRWCQVAPTPKQVGYYPRVKTAVGARVLDLKLNDRLWPDGQNRPEGEQNKHQIEWEKIEARRYDYGVPEGNMTVDQASYDIINVNAALSAMMAMTGRTVLGLSALDAAFGAGATTAATAGGGFVSAGTETAPYMKKIFDYAHQAIHKQTYGAVPRGDIICLLPPNVALAFSESAEFHSYLARSPFALAQLRGNEPNQNMKWNLPEDLYGMKIEVEDTVRVSSAEGATEVDAYLMNDVSATSSTSDAIYFISRIGGLEFNVGSGKYAPMNFSTLCMFEGPMDGREGTLGMAVEVFNDPYNKITKIHVVDNLMVEVVAPASGFCVKNTLA